MFRENIQYVISHAELSPIYLPLHAGWFLLQYPVL